MAYTGGTVGKGYASPCNSNGAREECDVACGCITHPCPLVALCRGKEILEAAANQFYDGEDKTCPPYGKREITSFLSPLTDFLQKWRINPSESKQLKPAVKVPSPL